MLYLYDKCYNFIIYYINGSVFRFRFRGKTLIVTKPLYRFGSVTVFCGFSRLRFFSVWFFGSVSIFWFFLLTPSIDIYI